MAKQLKKINFNNFRLYNSGLKVLSLFNNFEETTIELYKQIWDNDANSDELLDFINSSDNDEEEINELHKDLSFDDDETFEADIKIQNKNFEKYVNQALEFYISKNDIKDKNEVGYISSNLCQEDKIKQTIEHINNPKIKFIFNPVLGYIINKNNCDYLISSSVFGYDKITKKIVYIKYSKGTSQEFYLKGLYDYSIYKKIGLDVKDISIICIDGLKYKYDNIVKNTVNFAEVRGVWHGKDKPKLDKNAKDIQKFNLKINGFIYEKASEFGSKFDLPLIFWVERNLIPNVSSFKISGELETGYFVNFEKIISDSIDIINEPFGAIIDNIIENEKYINNYQLIINEVVNHFLNLDIDELKNKINSENYEDLNFYEEMTKLKWLRGEEINSLCLILMGKIHHQNGFNLYGKRNKFNLYNVKTIDDNFAKLPYFTTTEALNIIKNIHIKDSITVWYDYEGFSSIIPLINGVGPNLQIPNQVSVIKTVNGKRIWNTNIVVDTKNIKLINLVELIENIYDKNSNAYVVFNKTYENTRNKEIVELVVKTIQKVERYEYLCDIEDPKRHEFYEKYNLKDDIEFVEEFIKKGYVDDNNNADYLKFNKLVDHIINNTVDLADVFKYNSLTNELIQKTDYFEFITNDKHIQKPNNLKKYSFDDIKEKIVLLKKDMSKNIDVCNTKLAFVFTNYLKNKYSIKKIENFITSNDLQLKTRIKPYKTLEIQNGTMAMNEAIKRHAGITGEFAWQEISKSLKEYCENDVIAMIMVYELIMEIFRTLTNNISDFEYKIRLESIKNDGRYIINDDFNVEFLDR